MGKPIGAIFGVDGKGQTFMLARPPTKTSAQVWHPLPDSEHADYCAKARLALADACGESFTHGSELVDLDGKSELRCWARSKKSGKKVATTLMLYCAVPAEELREHMQFLCHLAGKAR